MTETPPTANTERERLDEFLATLPPDRRITLVTGNFNVIHPGHLRLLRFASECGDCLIVGVHPDGHPGAFVDALDRLDNVAAIGLVDFAFMLHDPLAVALRRIRPVYVVKGREHENKLNIETEILGEFGGHLLFHSGEIVFSSLDMLRREYKTPTLPHIEHASAYCSRRGIDALRLRAHLDRFKDLRVVVIGDLIVDEYVVCDPVGMSQEDPTIVVTPIESKRFIGGAGIVAAHAANLGASVRLLSLTGSDSLRAFAEKYLQEAGVDTLLFEDESRPTNLKQRFRGSGKTLLRVNTVRQHALSHHLQSRLFDAFITRIEATDLIIFSDFNYGALPQSLVDKIVDAGRKHNCRMAADSQSSSQMGNVARFRDMDLLTPTEREARLAVQNYSDGLVVLTEHLEQRAGCAHILLTLGAEGVLIHQGANHKQDMQNDRLPAMNSQPQDVSGAGDSLLVTASLALATGAPIWDAAYLGSISAAVQVSRVGNIPLSATDLLCEIDTLTTT